MPLVCFVLVVLTAFSVVVQTQDFEFDHSVQSCTLKDGNAGQCTPLSECPSAMDGLRRRQRPANCGFYGYPFVCCALSENLAVETKSEKSCEKFYKRKIESRFWYGGAAHGLTGGVRSSAREFPHMAALGYGEDVEDATWACGGSLISEKFVLTAAHCLATPDLGEVKFVRLGDLNLKEDNDDADPQDFAIARRVKHPQYKRPSHYHDIALLELDREVTISPYVKPACLQTDSKIQNAALLATGWGSLEFNGPSTDHLQKVSLREYTTEECRKFYGVNVRRLADGIVEDRQICAGEERKDTCQGDSGGPLQVQNSGYTSGYRIIGITSFGKACGISNSPGVYTRVSHYIDWIESVVWPN